MTPRAAQIRQTRAIEAVNAKLDRILELLEPASLPALPEGFVPSTPEAPTPEAPTPEAPTPKAHTKGK